MIDPDRTFVTGGRGLVGSCIEGNLKPSSKDLDLMNLENTIEYMRDNKVEYVIHCAGRVGGVQENMRNLGEFYYQNSQINLNVLEACRIVGVKKTLVFLSTCIFPDKARYPLTNDQIHNGEPHQSNYGYAYAKRMLEINARSYRDQYGMNIISVVPCNIYGPRDNFNLESSHVIPGLIHKAYLSKMNGTGLEVWGSGKTQREFLYSHDVGEMTKQIMSKYDGDKPVILSPNEEVSIREVAEKISKCLGLVKEVTFDSSKPDGQMRKPSDNSLMKELVKMDLTSIGSGIEQTVDWFVNNYEESRR